ncbi:hypothetical protein [Streptomyces sp. NPDC005780]|uniref:hypothetical protein n=1 Tax=Streptomyces sp. NPDC005780 TaxID=3364730 RepID=UPI0036C49B37
MGDYFQTIVDREISAADAAPMAARIVEWLVAEEVVGPDRTEPVIGSGPGHPPGPRHRAVVDSGGWSEPWQAGGLEIVTTRTVFDAGQYAEASGAGCPRCGRTTELRDEETWDDIPGAWDPFAAAEQAWLAGGDGQVRCTHCRAESPLTDWTGMDGAFAYGSLGFTFWGWPDLTHRFLAEFGLRLDRHRTALVRGKI